MSNFIIAQQTVGMIVNELQHLLPVACFLLICRLITLNILIEMHSNYLMNSALRYFGGGQVYIRAWGG